METKKTNRELLKKGLQNLLLTVFLFFLGPTILYFAFGNTNDAKIYIPLLILGIVICIVAVCLGFKALRTITDSFFNSENENN